MTETDKHGSGLWAMEDRGDLAGARSAEGDLAPWFDAGRAEAPVPVGDWMARMEAMALAEQPAPRAAPLEQSGSRARRGPGAILADFLSGLGGWPGLAGLAAACATGIWIGVAPPEGVSNWLPVSATSEGTTSFDPSSGFDFAMVGL